LDLYHTNENAEAITISAGFNLPPQDQIDQIVSYLETIQCNGEVLLAIVPIENPNNQAGKITITVFYWIIVLITILLLATMHYSKPVAKIYAIILIAGLIICGCAMVLWTIPPTSDQICIARWWLLGIGMVLFSGGVFCRSYQLKKIHQLVKSGRYQKSKNINHLKLLLTCMGIITLIEVIILLILQFTIPFQSSLIVVDEVIRTGVYNCQNDKAFLWVGIQSGYLVCILLMGVYSMYSTWKISSSVDDTRINILMIFLSLVTLAVDGVIWGFTGALPSNAEESDSWWALTIITIWEVCMMCSVFIPKLVKLSKQSSSSVGSHNTKPTTGTSTS